MKTTLIVIAAIAGIIVFSFIGYYNSDVGRLNQIKAKETQNSLLFDNAWKKISQGGQISNNYYDRVKDIFVGMMQERYKHGEAQAKLALVVTEASGPNVSNETSMKLMNIMESARDELTRGQSEATDMNRERNTALESFPGNIIYMILGRKPYDLKIVTSTKTEEAFKTGKEDDVNVFEPKK